MSLCLRGSNKLWHELIWPCRRTWAGLATAWVALLLFNAAHTERRQTALAKSSVPSTTVRLAFLEQRALMTEILDPVAVAMPAEPPRRSHPQPRSENQKQIRVA